MARLHVQARCKVPYRSPERVTTDLKELVVTTSPDGEEGHRTALASYLREALGHGKGNEFVLGAMADEDRAGHLADLAQIVEALLDEETDDRLGNPGQHGMGLLRQVRERTEHDQTGNPLAGGKIGGYCGTQRPATDNDLSGMNVQGLGEVVVGCVRCLITSRFARLA